MLETFTASTFSPFVGETFLIDAGAEAPVELELIAAEELESRFRRADAPRMPFSIVFRGPAELRLPQRMYAMEHKEIGAFEIFLVPIGPDEHGLRYEAVFN